MGLEMIVRAKRSSKARGTARCVLYGLADAAHLDGLAWPSRRELRLWGGCSEPTLSKALEALESSGELVVARGRRRPNGRQTSNAYWLPLYADPDAIQQTLKAQDDRTDLLGLFVDRKGDRLNPGLPLIGDEPGKPVFRGEGKPGFTPMLTVSVKREVTALKTFPRGADTASAHTGGQLVDSRAFQGDPVEPNGVAIEEQVGPPPPTIPEMVGALAEARGYPIGNFARHVRAAKRLIDQGHDPADVVRTVEYIRREAKYLDGQPVSMETVTKFIGLACPPATVHEAPVMMPDWITEAVEP